MAGSLPAGLNLLRTFQNAPWLGFVVKGIYDDIKIDSYEDVPYGGTLSELVEDARSGKIDRIYIAMSMKDETRLRDIISQLTDTTCSVLLIP